MKVLMHFLFQVFNELISFTPEVHTFSCYLVNGGVLLRLVQSNYVPSINVGILFVNNSIYF